MSLIFFLSSFPLPACFFFNSTFFFFASSGKRRHCVQSSKKKEPSEFVIAMTALSIMDRDLVEKSELVSKLLGFLSNN